ncbi:hypothetical protein [Piscirickettsia salmonis]|uniref:hypothetical protein n=1 Tax=Piscirickettsia salmonis TaxID=1238 RepID=UPI0007C8865E|nr:hypothetical protein A0O36_02774 [Piscirickettsiaceae bacterium NZ-RLO1]
MGSNSLDELAEKIGVDLSEKKMPKKNRNKFVAKRRRGWIEDDNKSQGEIIEKSKSVPINKAKENKQQDLGLTFSRLRGNPLNLIFYLHGRVSSRNFTTGKITQLEVIDSLNISRESARTALRFLLKNSLITRIDFQAGRSGWSIYSIDEKIFEEISRSRQENNV